MKTALSAALAVIATSAVLALSVCFPAHAQNMYQQVVTSCTQPNATTPQVGTWWPSTENLLGQECVNAIVPQVPNTPAAGTATNIPTGGTAVTAVTGPVNGCYLLNPLSASDQGIAVAENLYVNPVGVATTTGNGTTATLQPGQGYNCVPGQQTNLSVVAATNAHKFTLVVW